MVIFFLLFFGLLLINVPILYCMIIPCLYYLTTQHLSYLVVFQKMVAGIDSFPILAIPLFILAGQIMNNAGITEEIFDFCDKMVGHITGGLAHANIIASVIFAGMSGSAIADAGGLGAIEIKAMKEQGYDEDFAIAITGASSIIGPIIPPSIPAIVFAVATGVSVGQIFVAGVIPGLLMAVALGITCYFMCRGKAELKRKKASWNERWRYFKKAFFPLMTPVIVLIGTFSGIFTPTETGCITVAYSILIGIFFGTLKFCDLPKLFAGAARTTVSVSVLISASALFGYCLTRAQFPNMMSTAFTNITDNKYVFMILTNILLLIVGMFMDNSAAIPILAPILVPIATAYGINVLQYSIMFILNMMIGLLTPPVGLVLYTLSTVSDVPFERITRKMIPFFGSLIVVIILIMLFPSISTFLVDLVY